MRAGMSIFDSDRSIVMAKEYEPEAPEAQASGFPCAMRVRTTRLRFGLVLERPAVPKLTTVPDPVRLCDGTGKWETPGTAAERWSEVGSSRSVFRSLTSAAA